MFKNNKPIPKYFTKLVIKSGFRLPIKKSQFVDFEIQ